MTDLYENVDANIVTTIRAIRDEHNACTMHAVAARLHLSVSSVSDRCKRLRDNGIISYTKMMGSLSVVDGVDIHGSQGIIAVQPILTFTDEDALRLAAELTGAAPPEPVFPLSTLEEALRLEALGASTEVADVVEADGTLNETAVAAAMALAEAVPHSAVTKREAREVATVHRIAARIEARQPKVKGPKPVKVDTRTPERRLADQERMAALRARRAIER